MSQVLSNNTVAVMYSGPTLQDFTPFFWRVSVWDGAGSDCGWSTEVGQWETAGVWCSTQTAVPGTAQWITQDAPGPPPSDCDLYAEKPAPRFRKVFDVSQVVLFRKVFDVS